MSDQNPGRCALACWGVAPSPRPPILTHAVRHTTLNSMPSATGRQTCSMPWRPSTVRRNIRRIMTTMLEIRRGRCHHRHSRSLPCPASLQALEAGKHVSGREAAGRERGAVRRVAGTRVRSTELVLQVGNNKRFDPGIAFARSFAGGAVGRTNGTQGMVLRFCLSLHHDRQPPTC